MTATRKRIDNPKPSVTREERAFPSMPAAATAESRTPAKRPKLVFFYSHASGRCRRVEGFVAQVLQRRANHDTFDVMRVEARDRPDLHERFRVETLPTLMVIEDNRVRSRLPDPGGCAEIERFLAPWLR